ncbi:lysophospholipid acyltransferase family protein [Vibrio agarivorans]|uniref:lysophospholipid acyltransferase family protein n=1 Tax=Vibrio agarivorans TaxID=153622 RepID=UPI002232AE0F|nr:lysophospholipid acyltransferase family protein [Vibrio agarivorans]
MMSRTLRQTGFGVSFLLFGMGGIVLSYLFFPIIFILYRQKEERQDICQYWISSCFTLFVKFLEILRIVSIDTINKNRLDTSGGVLVIANHPTLIDVVIIISHLRQCDCIVKSSLWKNPFVRHVISMAGYIPNEAPDILERCNQKLSAGRKLLVFPEGTRTEPGEKVHCQRGAAQLAVRCGAEYQRILITSYPAILYKGIPWYQVPSCKPVIELNVMECESVSPFLQGASSASIAARRLTRYFDVALEPSYVSELLDIEDFAVGNARKQN